MKTDQLKQTFEKIPSIAPLQSDSQVMDYWQLNHANEFGQQAQMESTFLQQPVSDRLQ